MGLLWIVIDVQRGDCVQKGDLGFLDNCENEVDLDLWRILVELVISEWGYHGKYL